MVESACERVAKFFEKYEGRSYFDGELILRAEEEVEHVYYVKEGFVRLYAMSENGMELTLNIFKSGAYFPMTWAIGEELNRYYYEAITATKLVKVPKQEVLRFINDDKEVLYELTRRIVKGLGGLAGRMEKLFFGSARVRVAASLVMVVKRFGEKNKKGEYVIELPLSHQDVASLAGLTRETTSVMMKKFQGAGLISYKRRHIVILDMVRLEKIAGER